MAVSTKRILKRLRDAEYRNREARRRSSRIARWAPTQEFPFRELAAIAVALLDFMAMSYARRARRWRERYRDALDRDASLHRTPRTTAYRRATRPANDHAKRRPF